MSKPRRPVLSLGLVWLCLVCLMPITPIRAQSIINEEGIPVEYPLDPPHDIEWSAGFNEWSDVAAAFNYGRESENTLLGSALGEIVLPSADSWMAMSDGEKALWLINEERSARGLALLQGLEANVNAVAQSYAEWLLENNEFDHEADGRSPWERLDANASIAACHDFLAIAENLYLAATTSEDDIPFVVEQSIYRMIYDDASSLWGHRHAILWAAYTENSGATDREGFVGVGHAHGVYINPFDKRLYQNTDIIVLNFFDPCATWEGTTPVERTTPTPTATATPVSSPTPTVSPTPVPTSTPTPQPERSVSGRVTIPAGAAIEQRGSGIAGVTITSEDGLTTQTNANGEFVLQGLSAAKHTLTPSKEGYSFFPAVIEVDLTTYNFDGISFMGVSGPAGTELSFSLHLPYIDRD